MKIYNISPIFLQNIYTSLQGFMLKQKRYGEYYYAHLEKLRNTKFSDYEDIKRLQGSKIVELVKYAYNNSPFYREFYKDVDIDSIKTADDLKKLPILKKELVRQNVEKMYTLPVEEGIVTNTSGTTGKSMKFVFTEEDFQKRMAYLDFFKEQNGFVNLKMKKASFNSSKIVPPNSKKNIFWRDNLPIKQRIYSGYHCSGKNVCYYVENLNKYKPQAIDGYPSAIYEVAKYIVENNVTMTFVPIAIFPTAETLLPHYREVIEKAFSCPVLDQYASSEGAPFITECQCGNLHYCMDTGVIETGDDNEMIVTCFDTHGTPLIRYEIGDKVVFPKGEKFCDCGSHMPVVERIDGRTGDYLTATDGRKITSVYLSLVSADFLNSMKSMQFVQNTPDCIEIYIVADDKYDDSMKNIISDKLHYSLGENMNLIFHIVDDVLKDESGKFRLVKRNIV